MATSKDDSDGDQKQDLSTILSTEECVELMLLIARILEVMRKQQQHIFLVESSNPNVNYTQPLADTKEDDAARKLREKREEELSAPKMLELKEDSLDFFDKWRESVDSRVGAVVNNPKTVLKEQKEEVAVTATPSAVSTEPKVIREHLYCYHIVSIVLNFCFRPHHKYRRGRCRSRRTVSTNFNITLFSS
jgi:hypothetical protein